MVILFKQCISVEAMAQALCILTQPTQQGLLKVKHHVLAHIHLNSFLSLG